MSSANRDILTVSLPICISFIPSSCLIALARNFSTMLNRSGDSGHPCLVPDFRGNGVVCFLIVSLRCCRKVRGFSSRLCFLQSSGNSLGV
jgi:hypothetical protein